MGYKVLIRDADNRILAAVTCGSDMAPGAGQTIYDGIEGDIPNDIVPNSEWDAVNNLPVVQPKWHHLHVTASPSSILADGISTTTISIQKRDYNDVDLTDNEDNNEILITTTRGRLSAISGALVNGLLQVTLTSVAETVTTTVTATDVSGMLDSGSIDVTFTP